MGLNAAGFAKPGRIAIQGGSAGGMLMGAVANMAPELFRGIVAEVPFVDVLTTMLDDTLPLTPPEWPEWGNPIESKQAYENIMAYSPYDRVEAKPYPNIQSKTFNPKFNCFFNSLVKENIYFFYHSIILRINLHCFRSSLHMHNNCHCIIFST